MGTNRWNEAVFVDGEFRAPTGGGLLSVRDKASGEIFAVAGLAEAADVDAAAASAGLAQQAWASATYADRAAVLRAAATALSGRSAELRELIMRETGCIGGKADYEIGAATSELIEAAALASRSPGELVPTTHPGRLSLCERVPVGLVGVITPWNFPLVLGMRVIAPALALGNAVLIKPSPETPLSGGLAIAELFAEAGLPAGLFQVLPGDVEVGDRLVTHPDIAMIHFTGSTAVGRQIARTAGGLLKKVSLELGGNNALIVLDDAELDQAAMIGAWSSFHYQGQTCITAGRHIVTEGIAPAYIDALAKRASAITTGNTVTENVGLGPMINQRQLDRAAGLLADAVAEGATVVAGGTTNAPFFQPTVVTGVPTSSALWTEEIFARSRRSWWSPAPTRRSRSPTTPATGWSTRWSPRTCSEAGKSPGNCGRAWCTSTTPPRKTRQPPRSAGSASRASAAAPAATPTSRSSPSAAGSPSTPVRCTTRTSQ